MSYLFKQTELKDKTPACRQTEIWEVKTRNYYVFTILVFLSITPAVLIVAFYFRDNVNLFRILYVLLIIIISLILSGKGFIKILFKINNKTREGSIFSFKNPVRYTIKK